MHPIARIMKRYIKTPLQIRVVVALKMSSSSFRATSSSGGANHYGLRSHPEKRGYTAFESKRGAALANSLIFS
jgi:hypothetical protein